MSMVNAGRPLVARALPLQKHTTLVSARQRLRCGPLGGECRVLAPSGPEHRRRIVRSWLKLTRDR
jgi:hypothetical protein